MTEITETRLVLDFEPNTSTRRTDRPDAGPALQIHLLGGVRASRADGDPIDIGPAKCQALLAALALSPGSTVPVARLVELIWGDERPRTAEKTLQSYATQLRKGLGPERIMRVGAAYRLDIDPDGVDVGRFERRLGAGDVAGALSEWGGPPLAGLEPAGLAGAVAGLTEQWLGAVETDLEEAVAHDPAGSIGRLTELTAGHPFREGLWALFMTALYATGRQAEALAAYGRARTHLVEELGVEPGPRLRHLEAQILNQADDLDSQVPTPRSQSTRTETIPAGTVTFAFTDVEDSTGLWANDRVAMAKSISRHEEIVVAATTANGGHIFAAGGDSFGVAFHRADQAAIWAQEVQAALTAEPWSPAAPIAVRIGLNTGEAEERGDNYFGPPVNVAARIANAGHGRQTLVSSITAALLQGHDLRQLGPIHLDGVQDDQVLWQLGPGDHPPLRVEDAWRGNLPRPSTRLIGRDDLIENTVDAIREGPIVTLVGPGGIGKTSVALAAARVAADELRASAWLVELADITSSDDVIRAVADQLNLKEIPGRALLDSVVIALRHRRALLVLDNCEHVIDGAAEVADALAWATGLGTSADEAPPTGLRVLTTSREGLGLAGEQVIVVGPLDSERHGVELFNQRASSVDRTFDSETNHTVVAEICRRLDGVPLAIELAAARVRTLAPDDLVKRLDDSFRVLSGGRRRSVERHRTLRTTIRWSYDLLSPTEQLVFQRLSIFAGFFDLAAAEAVVAGEAGDDGAQDGAGAGDPPVDRADVNSVLGDLVERSMVQAESGSHGRRFRLLEIMRQFGAEQLAERGSTDAIAQRHASYVAEEATRLGHMLADWREVEGAARLAELWPNLRAAFDWAESSHDVDLAVRLVNPIAVQTFTRRGMGEIADWAARLLAMANPDDEETITLGLLWSAFHYSMTHDREAFARLEERYGRPDNLRARAAHMAVMDETMASIDLSPKVAEEFRRRGDSYLASLFDIFVAGSHLGVGNLDEAMERAKVLVNRFKETGPATFYNWAVYLQAAAIEFGGDRARAEELYDLAVAVQVPPRTNSPNEVLSARVDFRNGRHRAAFARLRDYARDLAEVSNLSAAGFLSIEFVNMMMASGRLDEAAKVLGYLDRTGILDVEGPAFRLLVVDSSALVDENAEAADIRRSVAETDGIGDRWGLDTIASILDQILDEPLTGGPDQSQLGTTRPTLE